MLSSFILTGALAATLAGGAPADTLASPALYLRPTEAQAALFSPPGPREGATPADATARSAPEPQVVEYSDAYFTRLTIHKWASWLTLPLFVGQYAVGRKLINGNGSDHLRSVHGVLAGSIAGLFAVNTVTGGLNAIEAWHDPDGRNRRTLHTVLMLAADLGFVITGATAQERENEGGVVRGGNNNTHRAVALASMGTALVGVAVMLPIFGKN